MRRSRRPAAARTLATAIVACLALAACGTAPPDTRAGIPQPVPAPPALPDADGWGAHVLALAGAPTRATWVGTWDGTLFMLPYRSREWRQVAPAAIAAGPINSIAFERDTAVVWYGTAGGGFARSADGGDTWRAWPQSPTAAWNHVVPQGIVVVRDTVYVATTDGLRYTGDGGITWRCVQGTRPAGGAAPTGNDGCTDWLETLPTSHLLALEVTPDGALHVGHLRGLSRSTDGGRSWTDEATPGLAGQRVRSVRLGRDSLIWALTETALYADSPRVAGFREVPLRVPGFPTLPGGPRAIIAHPGQLPTLVATSYGMLGETAGGDFRLYFLSAADRFRPAGDIWTGAWWGPPMIPLGGSAAGLSRVLAGESPVPAILDMPARSEPAPGHHLRLARPVADADGSPYVDGTALFGAPPAARPDAAPATGIRFLNPPGTPVRAAAAGVVVRAADGRVVLRHEGAVEGRILHTAYDMGGAAAVAAGQQVAAGDVLGRVARAAGPAGVGFTVHALTAAETAAAATATALPAAMNPQLWLEPLPGTGIVAGQVFNAGGEPVAGAAVRGLVLPYPTEAPFSYVRTHARGFAASPAYGEHFALGDVPAGDYTVGVVVDGRRVWRRIRVAPGQVTWVEFRP
jgi:hypothetical protein